LQLCAELESLQDGKKVHSCIYAGNLLGIWGMGGWFFYNMRNGKVFSLESNHEWVCKDRWFPRECVCLGRCWIWVLKLTLIQFVLVCWSVLEL
jgi:hypothetical protein